jgi:hypothetical protein
MSRSPCLLRTERTMDPQKCVVDSRARLLADPLDAPGADRSPVPNDIGPVLDPRAMPPGRPTR